VEGKQIGARRECPLWVISGQIIAGQKPPLSALVQKRTNASVIGLSALYQEQTSQYWFQKIKEAGDWGGLDRIVKI
jgi:hypothetical protein